ncbi:MAG TPA: type I restriction enzyme HsdR N-terminal domain-containing protein [Chitinophagaceae bacterium]|nr:type I restriction enzyme HsdR N-terminal domain-containing protein [Chitinophagaceae bacterium]
MVIINYPKPAFRIKKEAGKDYIFDMGRKKWLLVTPEEWVRQNFIHYLITVKNYPASLIATEKEIRLGELKKRFDIVVYDPGHRPWMMVECKAQEIVLDEKVLEQVLRYNISVPVEYLIITNGNQCYAWQKKEGKLELITELPSFPK